MLEKIVLKETRSRKKCYEHAVEIIRYFMILNKHNMTKINRLDITANDNKFEYRFKIDIYEDKMNGGD